jgi:DNA-binding transcriptional MerR regulator
MMKDWITIGQLAKKTGLTARAIRFYESKGLLRSHSRGDNDYRFYSKSEVTQAERIKNFKDFGFTLGEIAELLAQDPTLTTENLQNSLKKKLKALKADHLQAVARIQRLEALIASLNTAHKLSEPQRRIIMEELVTQAKQKIKARGVAVSGDLERSLRHELQAAESTHFTKMMGLLDVIKEIADEMKITIGPGRGPAAGSLLLFSKGFNHNYSQQFDLLPELFFHAIKPLIWVDVEYDAGPEFLNRLLKRTTLEELRDAKIFIFQCPFLSVMAHVEKHVGPIDHDAIPDHDPRVLSSFVNGQADQIFCFDAPEKSVMHANSALDFWQKENELKRATWKHLETYKVKDAKCIWIGRFRSAISSIQRRWVV